MNLKNRQYIELKAVVFLLPNIFTALNMLCGLISVTFTFKEQYVLAATFIVIAAIFDSVDGRLARLTHSQSEFGEQFDSFSDLISFGFAPTIMIYMLFFSEWNIRGILISFFFLLCGALRLARFNINNKKISKDYFQGLAIPMAALAIIALVYLNSNLRLEEYVTMIAIYYIFYSFLMISNIPFYSFKSFKYKKMAFILIIFLVSTLFLNPYMMFAYINIYVLVSIILFIKNGGKLVNIFSWIKEENDELD